MNVSFPWTALSRVVSGGHLGQLHHDLVALGDRVRAMVAEAIGRAVGSAARQTVLALLGQPDAGRLPTPFPTGLPSRPQPLWGGLENPDQWDDAGWSSDQRDWELPVQDDREEAPFLAPRQPREDAPSPRPWRPALALALQAVAWWLWRQTQRWPVRAALGFSLACGLALYLSGTLIENKAGMALTLLTNTLGAIASA